MKIRNTTDFDTAALRTLLRRVVREVEDVLAKDHPLRFIADELGRAPRWTEANVHNRATLILEHCDVWIRQRRPAAVQARRKAECLARASELRDEAARAESRTVVVYRGDGPPVRVYEDADTVRENLLSTAARYEQRATELGAGPTHTTGRAWLHGRKLRLTLGDADAAKAAWLMRHEVWHLFGIGHEHFPRALMHEDGGALAAVRDIYGLAEGETLPRKAAPAPKAAPDPEARAAAKLAGLVERQKAWASKLKRAQTALAKIQKQTRYYERTLAVAASRKRGGAS